jgi:osmotically inducible lipoprotein OsmB
MEMTMKRLAIALSMLTMAACSTGGVIGGVAGGVAGNKLGDGSTVATIGGAAAGAVIGDQIQKRM